MKNLIDILNTLKAISIIILIVCGYFGYGIVGSGVWYLSAVFMVIPRKIIIREILKIKKEFTEC